MFFIDVCLKKLKVAFKLVVAIVLLNIVHVLYNYYYYYYKTVDFSSLQ